MNNRNDAFYSDQEALEIIKKALDSGRVEITALQSALLGDGSTKEPVFCISLTLLDVEEENEGHVQMTGLVQTYREVSIPKPKPECPEHLVSVNLDYCDADDCYADLEYHDELSAGLCRECQRRINGAKDGEK